MENRYLKNIGTLTLEEQMSLKNKKVLIIGAGGLGGDVIDGLVRLGIGHLRVVDSDRFEETNLNRQLLSSEKALGELKVKVAMEHIKNINSETVVEIFSVRADKKNMEEFFSGMDLALDCTDNIETKLLLEDCAQRKGIPLVYGAVGGWYGNAALIMPEKPMLKNIYSRFLKGIEEKLGNPRFIVAMIAAVQMNLALKGLLNKYLPEPGFIYVDMKDLEFHWIEVKG